MEARTFNVLIVWTNFSIVKFVTRILELCLKRKNPFPFLWMDSFRVWGREKREKINVSVNVSHVVPKQSV